MRFLFIIRRIFKNCFEGNSTFFAAAVKSEETTAESSSAKKLGNFSHFQQFIMIYNIKRSTKLLAFTKTAVSILIFVLVLTITVGLSLDAYGRKADQVNDELISIVKIFFFH